MSNTTMQTLRALSEKNNNNNPNKGFWDRIRSANKKQLAKDGLHWSKINLLKVARFGGKTLWVSFTVALLTIIPIMLEVEREVGCVEIEKLQIDSLKAQGYTNDQLQNMGFQPESYTKSESLKA